METLFRKINKNTENNKNAMMLCYTKEKLRENSRNSSSLNGIFFCEKKKINCLKIEKPIDGWPNFLKRMKEKRIPNEINKYKNKFYTNI